MFSFVSCSGRFCLAPFVLACAENSSAVRPDPWLRPSSLSAASQSIHVDLLLEVLGYGEQRFSDPTAKRRVLQTVLLRLVARRPCDRALLGPTAA